MFGLFLTCIKPLNTTIVLWFIFQSDNWLAALAILWLMLCDIFDGYFFRRSRLAIPKYLWWRRIADVVGDRFAIEVVLLTMIFRLDFPFYLYATDLVREFVLLGIWLYSYKIGRPFREPNMYSRLSTLFVGIMAITWLTFPTATAWFFLPVFVFGVIGCEQYWETIQLRVQNI